MVASADVPQGTGYFRDGITIQDFLRAASLTPTIEGLAKNEGELDSWLLAERLKRSTASISCWAGKAATTQNR